MSDLIQQIVIEQREDLEDFLFTAMCGVGYWARVKTNGTRRDFIEGRTTYTIEEIDEVDGSVIETFTLTRDKLIEALIPAAIKLYIEQHDEFMAEYVVQMAVLGEQRYA